MKPLTPSEIISLQRPMQHFSDCYMTSSIGALARSSSGKKILNENIVHTSHGFRIRFQNVNSRQEDYIISKKEIKKHNPVDIYEKTVADHFQNLSNEKAEFLNNAKLTDLPRLYGEYYSELLEKFKPNRIINALEIAMDNLLKKHPDKKPLISRLIDLGFDERFEYNYPSNFLEMFTGKKPIILNEQTLLRMNLRKNKDEAIELFEKIDNADDFSMVAGTGLFARCGLTSVHCYTVEGVNSENQYLQMFDCRQQKSIKLSFDNAINALKFLTGYLE